jgi:hypothetical protein
MTKRIIFSTATPNDQGGVIPNNVIDFLRFNKNPVCLNEHQWGSDPIGMWTDIKLEGGKWSGVPVFHGLTEDSKTKKALYEAGFIRASSIGGEAIWEENSAGQYKLDKDGNKLCKKFILYEISIVTLPSNEDAVQEDLVELHAKIYTANEMPNIITTLSTNFSKYNSNFNSNKMITKKEFSQLSTEEKAITVTEMKSLLSEVDETVTDPKEASKLAAAKLGATGENLPKWLSEILQLGGAVSFGTEKAASKVPVPKDEPESTQVKDKEIADREAGQIGLKAKKEAAMEAAKDKAAKATEKVKAAKEAAEKEGASADDKAAYEAAKCDADDAMKACEAAEKKMADDNDEDEDEEDDKKAAKEKKSAKVKSTNAAAKKVSPEKPVLKTMEELKADLKLATAPSHMARVKSIASGKTFSELAASKDANDQKLLLRVRSADAGGKDIAEYAAVLNSILNDGKLKAITDKTRILMNVSENQIGSFQNNPNIRRGTSLQELSAQMNRGEIDTLGSDNVLRKITTLSSSDTALATPALNAIEWLSLAIFKLFPSNAWKNEIPVFGAEMTGKNTGIIWANIAADPTVYKGTQPTTPADYTYTDTAVSLSLTPYWLQPMRWTPLTMHQLRYDQMGAGWAQAFSKWNAVIDDNLIFTLASTVPAGNIFKTTGLSGYQTTPTVFGVTGASDPNSFYWNPAFTAPYTGAGALKTPTLNDLISMEQLYSKQDFELSSERPTLVTDPTMHGYLDKDPETKTMLTRWINQDGGEFPKFKNTLIANRSRVAIYNPSTGLVIDPNASIPSTSISAGLGFIPSQVGIGLGMLDVFMIQDPTNYGYKMSADIRMGIAPLRADFKGTSLLTYGNI